MTMIQEITKAVKEKIHNIQTINNPTIGGTGYIDKIQPSHLDGTVAIGEDLHGRKFVAVKVHVEGGYNKSMLDTDGNTICTMFERYTDVNHDTVVSGGFSWHGGAFDEEALYNLKKLLNGETITLDWSVSPIEVSLA